mgnify:CR=1 FL=1
MRAPSPITTLYRSASGIVLGIAVVAVIVLAWFTYERLYRTFTDAQAIAILRTTVAVEDIDQARLTAIRDHLRARAALPPLVATTVRDVFRAAGAAPTERSDDRRP